MAIADADISPIIDAIYAIVLQPDALRSALKEIRDTIGGTGSALITAEPQCGRAVDANTIPTAASDSYINHYRRIDYVLQAVEHSPVGFIHSGEELISRAAGSEFDVDWMRPFDLRDGLFVRLTSNAAPTSFLVTASHGARPFATTERIRTLNKLVPHLQQALRIQRHIGEVTRTHSAASEIADSIRHGLLLVTADGLIRYANRAAEAILGRNDGITVRSGVLETICPKTNAALRRAVDTAASDGQHLPGSTSLLCPRLSEERAYIVHVSPHTAPHPSDCYVPASRTDSVRLALISITDPVRSDIPTRPVLQQLYGLTPAESNVAIRMLNGSGLQATANDLSVSIDTVKTHMRHIFDKTGARRQAELVRLLMSIKP